ncbi:MAG: class 1 fructose-bisphosphatase [Acidimicrobiales bacterium]|nr:MAG: class 1 fructose-bisphosphatase [Acidimicrobiales bacterium]
MNIDFSTKLAKNIEEVEIRTAVLDTVNALCESARDIAKICAKGPLEAAFGDVAGTENSDGDSQKALDVRSDEIITAALKTVPVAYYASEERDDIITLEHGLPLAVASDPLDGSSNIDTNVSIGTIFAIFPAVENDPEASFLRKGSEQVAGGFFVYGPQTSLVITTGDGTELYILDWMSGKFKLAVPAMRISESSHEFAINASNFNHWHPPVRAYIEDAMKGADGPMGKKQGMRWVGSLVADANRILMRGGLFMYPADDRKGYEAGRLRILYEAHPVAFVIEQAGGKASNGTDRILDIKQDSLHERVPFVFGSVDMVEQVGEYHINAV